jgi:hypothetical protein
MPPVHSLRNDAAAGPELNMSDTVQLAVAPLDRVFALKAE